MIGTEWGVTGFDMTAMWGYDNEMLARKFPKKKLEGSRLAKNGRKTKNQRLEKGEGAEVLARI